MPEPPTVPVSQPAQDPTIAADRPERPAWWRYQGRVGGYGRGPTWWRYRYTWIFGGAGLLFLLTGPDVGWTGARWKVLGLFFELYAAFLFILAWRRDRKKAGNLTSSPEPYANLQAAMEQLHETEDKATTSR